MDFHIIRLDRIDSTNTYLDRLAKEGYPHGTVVIAEYQTAGRGRFGRYWFSPPGKNIYMSILLRPLGIGPRELSVLPLLTGIACQRTIQRVTGLEARLKWPNDLLLNERKLGGILVESRIEGSSIYFITGIGINVNMTREELPEEIRDIATSLYMVTGKEFPKEVLIERLLGQFSTVYKEFLALGKAYIISEWQSLSSTIGRRVRCLLPDGTERQGKALALDEEGYLLVDVDGRLEIIMAGDVFHEPDNH